MIKYIEFNGITFGRRNYIKINGADFYTPFIISEFDPNGGETAYQRTDLIGDGAVYSNFRYNPRIVSLKGYILPKKGERIEDLRCKLASLVNGKTVDKLTYFDGENSFFCECFGDIPVFSKPVKESVLFNINFTVPDFFWYSSELTSIPVSQRVKNITNPFTLPRVFTIKTANAAVYNHNDFNIYPIIKIIANEMTSTVSLVILNDTTGEKITLSQYAVSAGEAITIDLKSLTADVGGVSVINYFNDFSDFAIIPGNNLLKVTDSNGNSKITVAVEFNRQYVCI